MFEKLLEEEEKLKTKSVKIANINEGRKRFASLVKDRRHEANVALEAATSEVLTVREDMKHCREETA